MDATAILGIIGGIALLAALYGGLEIDKLKISPLPVPIRYISGITGAMILIFIMWISIKSVTQPTVTPSITINSPVITSETQLATDTPTDMPTSESSPYTCGPLKLTAMRPSTLMENEIRLYKLIGSGFCKDTEVTLSGWAFVGNDPGTSANSIPVEVASDGTWLTIYIRPSASPGENGQTITAKNPDGNEATLFTAFQR